jgi:hypothetical protein
MLGKWSKNSSRSFFSALEQWSQQQSLLIVNNGRQPARLSLPLSLSLSFNALSPLSQAIDFHVKGRHGKKRRRRI